MSLPAGANTFLKGFGYEDFLVEAAGDLHAAAGELTKGRRKIWIRHPRKPNAFFANMKVDAGSVATSGDYERFLEMDGERHHHLLNPKTGYPADSVVSVTILADNVTRAVALATAVFVLGPKACMDLIEADSSLFGLMIVSGDYFGSRLTTRISKKLTEKISIMDSSDATN